MVRFASVISSAAVARVHVNTQRARAARNGELSTTTTARGRPGKLPSLYPAISLKSLHSREAGLEFDQSGQGGSHNTAQPSLDASEQSGEIKVKGTSLVVGATGILRAATALAVDTTTAETTVQRAEQQIEEPECEVNNFRIGLLKLSYQLKFW